VHVLSGFSGFLSGFGQGASIPNRTAAQPDSGDPLLPLLSVRAIRCARLGASRGFKRPTRRLLWHKEGVVDRLIELDRDQCELSAVFATPALLVLNGDR